MGQDEGRLRQTIREILMRRADKTFLKQRDLDREMDQIIAAFDEHNPLREEVETLRERLADADRARVEADERAAALEEELDTLRSSAAPGY